MQRLTLLLAALLLCASCDEKTTSNHCGDGVVDTGEECDGTVDPLMSTCQSEGYYSGVLSCKSDCSFDASDCAAQGFCGDEVIQFNYEQCEGSDINGSSCEALGYHLGGELGCNSNCRFDTTSCVGDPVCGNDVIEGSEECDGTFFDTTCEELGYHGGELACTDTCALDETLCSNCGNNFIDEGEDCEGINLNGHSCMEMGYWQGELECDSTCHFAPCEEFIQVASGGYHTCGITNYGNLYCWGANNNGQVGIGNKIMAVIPSLVPHPSGGIFTEVAC
ncbi:hypothetical protein KKF84_21680, partial [Myxococcota bacterium]|nr:hypothetical protein [Myxococcota bacterium]